MQPTANTVFFDVLTSVDNGLLLAATKLFPVEAIQAFEIGPKGKFELIFDKAYKGVAIHADENLNKKLVGKPPLQLAEVVKGQINKQEKSVRFEPDGIKGTATLEKWGMSMELEASITEIRVVEGGLSVSAKCGLELSRTVDYGLIAGAFVQWR